MTVVLQTYLAGKSSPEACEDVIFHDRDFVAVIDGTTDKTGIRIDGRTGGLIVAETVRNVLRDRQALPANASFEDWVTTTTEAIRNKLNDIGWPQDDQRPAASAVVHSRHRGEIWRVGDCHFRIDGVNHLGGKEIDEVNSEIRREALQRAIDGGASVEQLLSNDVGREAIADLLKRQHLHANETESGFGYPVFNGDTIPPTLLEAPVPVNENNFVVFCSDGIDFPHETLQESLIQQRRSYEADPLRMGLDGIRASTKGLALGAERHDDQAYVSFMPSRAVTAQDQAQIEAWNRMLSRDARKRQLLRRFGLLGIATYLAFRSSSDDRALVTADPTSTASLSPSPRRTR